MVFKRSGHCIFSCDSKKCINDSTETFRDVICPYHLSHVFGLKVAIDKFETESSVHLVGPFLIVDDSFSFKPNTVVFPERGYIDQFMSITPENPDSYKFILNPRMEHYLNNLRTSTPTTYTLSEARYQLEIIRNLFFIESDKETKDLNFSTKTNLVEGTATSNKQLNAVLQTRFQQLNSVIQLEDYNEIFKKITVFSMNDNIQISLDKFTPFMSFMIFNCLIDEHKLPVADTNNSIGVTCFLNLVYVKGVGLVTTQDMLNPSHLVVSGNIKGNNTYYQLKVRSFPKQTVQNVNVYKRSLADNVRSSNVLNTQSDFCWTK